MVIRYTTVLLPVRSVSPGVADSSAFACVVTTASVHRGRASPFTRAKLAAIESSLGTADDETASPGAGTLPAWAGAPAKAAYTPRPTAAAPTSRPAMPRR